MIEIENKGLFTARVPGVYDDYETMVDLTILGGAVHASYKSHDSFSYRDPNDFGKLDLHTHQFDLEVYILADDEDSPLLDALTSYANDPSQQLAYEYYAKSEVWQIRALVAMNGKCLKYLSKDSNPLVRRKVVEYLVGMRETGDGFSGIVDFGCADDEVEHLMFQRFVPLSINLGDISYIDDMIHDEDDGVRYNIARLGLERHIDVFIKDSSPYVRMAAAYHGQERHLEQLLNDSSREVLRLVVCNQNATKAQLETIAQHVTFTSVQDALMARGIYHPFFIENSKDDWLTYVVISHGHEHARLSKDESPSVRESVARSATDTAILEVLASDEDEDVRLEATLRLMALGEHASPVTFKSYSSNKHRDQMIISGCHACEAQFTPDMPLRGLSNHDMRFVSRHKKLLTKLDLGRVTAIKCPSCRNNNYFTEYLTNPATGQSYTVDEANAVITDFIKSPDYVPEDFD